MENPVAANVLGTTGAVCWSVQVCSLAQLPKLATTTNTSQLIPQIIINYRRHNTTGLQPSMMILWALAGIPLGVYNIVSGFNVALRIQPQILTFLSLLTWGQCMFYEQKWSKTRVAAWTASLNCVLGGVEVGLVFGLQAAQRDGARWAMTLMAVLSAVLLAAGVLRHYWDIWKMRTVRGISFLFVFIDALGDLTSLLSLFFEPKLDVLGMVIYGSELVLWMGVFACGGYYNFGPWVRRLMKRHRGSVRPQSVDAAVDSGIGHSTALPGVELSGVQVEERRVSSSSSVFRTPFIEISDHIVGES